MVFARYLKAKLPITYFGEPYHFGIKLKTFCKLSNLFNSKCNNLFAAKFTKFTGWQLKTCTVALLTLSKPLSNKRAIRNTKSPIPSKASKNPFRRHGAIFIINSVLFKLPPVFDGKKTEFKNCFYFKKTVLCVHVKKARMLKTYGLSNTWNVYFGFLANTFYNFNEKRTNSIKLNDFKYKNNIVGFFIKLTQFNAIIKLTGTRFKNFVKKKFLNEISRFSKKPALHTSL
ncbi:hypothetical protein GGTG_02115 [Gaeumannomyces tritici R3-111a-1]|uniref:Uncharacterized protein n=1 Tax=Gaeumannomyces tritici (strain R3-111a-1) TaxID=644352 RepID=J3NLG6_GAET3|nr:hypothetical protein GGTG_02115 [Gaeumannomyces tritici R3-111a-1]EJT82141.1 hypothetical protein GGTG_02115 [Gaeumannomyces tritici R3-111a-1]